MTWYVCGCEKGGVVLRAISRVWQRLTHDCSAHRTYRSFQASAKVGSGNFWKKVVAYNIGLPRQEILIDDRNFARVVGKVQPYTHYVRIGHMYGYRDPDHTQK